MDQLREVWAELSGTMVADRVTMISLIFHLFLGGFLALLVRLLFRKCSVSASSSDSISRIFPLLTIITTAVIAIVKSSLALSLGLVGALSIVRFRAAIKEPEELVYLFLCIAIGLALGAEQPVLALGVVAVASIFTIGMHLAGRAKTEQNLLLTITGDSERHFKDEDQGVFKAIREVAGRYTLQRYDLEDGRGQIRVMLPPKDEKGTTRLISELRSRLPDCEMSYVNLKSPL